MRRVNVREAQLDACLRHAMFAISARQAIEPGELLLLQLDKHGAVRVGKEHSRIEHAIVFDHLQHDPTGQISRRYWPAEGRVWPYIVYGSHVVPTMPFSLEDLPLSRSYSGQTSPMRLSPEDEAVVLPLVRWPEDGRASRAAHNHLVASGTERVAASVRSARSELARARTANDGRRVGRRIARSIVRLEFALSAGPGQAAERVALLSLEPEAVPSGPAGEILTALDAAVEPAAETAVLDFLERRAEWSDAELQLQEVLEGIGLAVSRRWQPAVVNSLLESSGRGQPELQQALIALYRGDGGAPLKVLREEWSTDPAFAARERIYQQAIEAHLRRRYDVSIPATLPLIEGITREVFAGHGGGFMKLVEKGVATLRVLDALLVDSLVLTLRAIFGTLPDEEQVLSADVLNRNAILHGRIASYGTEMNSLRAFLTLDQLYWQVRRHRRASTG